MSHQLFRSLAYRLSLRATMLTSRNQAPRHFKRVILKLDRLGDAVLALGAVRLLIENAQPGTTLLVVSPIAEPLFRSEFPRVECLVLPAVCSNFYPDFIQFLRTHSSDLSAIHCDDLIGLRHQPSDYLRAIVQLIHAAQVHELQWSRSWGRLALTTPVAAYIDYPQATEHACSELEAHRLLVSSVLDRNVTLPEIFPCLSAAMPLRQKTLLVCPAAGDPIRQYPPRLLAEAVAQFVRIHSIPVKVCVPEGFDAMEFLASFKLAGIENVKLHIPKNYHEFVEIISKAGMILSPDSSTAHLAISMDKPAVCILGGGHHGMFAPWTKSRKQRWVDNPVECYHCRWRCPFPEPVCITDIPPASVAQALHEVWSLAEAG